MTSLTQSPYKPPVVTPPAPPPAPPTTPPASPAGAAPLPYGSTSVEKRVNDIASKDSQLNQMARTEAYKVMNRRGMLNSSLTAGAAQDAVLRSALPIASQDASQAFQGEEQRLNREYDAGQADLDRKHELEVQKRQQAHEQAEAKLDRDTQTKLASWNLKSSDRNSAAQFLVNMDTLYQSDVQSIMANTALSATARAAQLKAAKQLRDRRFNLVQQMYNVKLKW